MGSLSLFSVLTPSLDPPVLPWIEPSLIKINPKMNKDLMFDVEIRELSLTELIGLIRTWEEKCSCRFWVVEAKYFDTFICNKWVTDLAVLPSLKPWQTLALSKGRSTLLEYILDN